MAKLLPNNLDASNSIEDDQTTITKCKQQDVTQIMDWIQCFSNSIAVAPHTKPNCVADLIPYLNVITNNQRHFEDFDWALYDCQFRQKSCNNICPIMGDHGRHPVKSVTLQLQY